MRPVRFSTIMPLIVLAACTANSRPKGKISYDENSLKNFVLTTHPDKDRAMKGLDSILNRASKDSIVFNRTISFLEVPFGDPNSAYRDEDIYAELLQKKIQSSWVDDLTKEAARKKLHLLMQNRPGHLANDFTYLTPAGYKRKMYDLKSDYVLLFFYNPECNACKEMKAALENSAVINAKIRSRKLQLLAVYTDPDEKIWLNHLAEYPADWIQGTDQDEYLYKNGVYNLNAIPTVYLLDKNKTVILKDCMDVREIEKGLSGDPSPKPLQ